MDKHFQIIIIGGGTGGIMTAANLLSQDKSLQIAIVEPAEYHYYQAAWTLVGANSYDFAKTRKKMADVIPPGVTWIKDLATGFQAPQNSISTQNTGNLTYDYLIVSPGLVMDTDQIEGLTEALDKGVVCSNYTDPEHTWEVLKNFKGGNAIFTQPTTPIKCGGAPQKIAYLAADYIAKQGLKNSSNVILAMPGNVIFGVPVIKDTLMRVIERYGIHFKPRYAPIKIDGENKIITFRVIAQEGTDNTLHVNEMLGEKISSNDTIELPFDLLHIAPPQVAPAFVRNSDLANEAGWLDVDIHSLQHKKYGNIFGLGDVAALPTAKTGAAIRKQVPVVVANVLALLKNNQLSAKIYEGYSSCPLVTGYGKMVLAEFNYKNEFTPDPNLKKMFISDSSKEHWRLWILKKYLLPWLYWNKMLKGKEV